MTLFQFLLSASNLRYTQQDSWTVTPTGANSASASDFAGNAYLAETLYFYAGDGAHTIDAPVLGVPRTQDATFLVLISYYMLPTVPGFRSSAVQLSRTGTIQAGRGPAQRCAYECPGRLSAARRFGAAGTSLDYRFARTTVGVVMQDNVTGLDGTQVAGTGHILFKDGVGIADLARTAADLLRLYSAGLGHLPPPADLALWTRAADAGGFSMADLAHSIARQPGVDPGLGRQVECR